MNEMLAKIERRNKQINELNGQLTGLKEEKDRRDNENTIHIDQLKKLVEYLKGKCDKMEAQIGGKSKKRDHPETPIRTPLKSPPPKRRTKF